MSKKDDRISKLADSLHVRSCVEELVAISGKSAPPAAVNLLIRLLRPAASDMSEFSNALKQKIRQSLLSRVGGAALTAKFEKSCEGFRRTEGNVQHSVLPSFLAIFLPLMSAPNRTSFNTSSSSLLLDENRHRASAIAPKSSLPISLEIEGGMSQSTHGQKQRMGEKKKKSSTQNDSNSYVSGNGRKQQLVKVSTLPGRGLLLPPSSNAPSLLDYAEDEREEDAMLLTQYHDVLEAFWLSPQLEADLIRDLLFVFQGITGKYIRYDPRSESYIIDPSLPLRAHIKDLILCLCELGWLYSRVDGYIQQAEKDKFRGLVTHAFGFALQEELHDYYRLLAVLEQELGRKLKGIEQENKERGGSAHPGKGSFGGLTLIRLKAWVQEPLERMVLMARLVDSAAPLSGGALSSRLYGHCKHGDPMVHAFTLRLMTAVNNPLNAMLTRWLLHGELQDIHHEFFITDTQSAMTSNGSSSGHAWHSMFRLRLPMLPSFIPLDLANKILTVGKSISFIRVCIENLGKSAANGNSNPLKAQGVKMPRESIAHAIHGNKDTREDFDSRAGMEIEVRFTKEGALGEDLSSRTEELGSCLEQLTSSEGRHRLDTLIGSISSSIDAQLLHLMESRFYLSTHLASLKKFMLLGQGDFVTCLMDAIAPELKKKASLLYRHNLTGMLEGALRSSNAQFEASYVLERVGVRLLDSSPGDTGWEIFSLDYHIDAPLSAVIHPEAMSKYRIAFGMLWRLKRLEWMLSAAFRQLMSFHHMRGLIMVPRLRNILHQCSLSRAFMIHVINNLCAFLQFEVIESAWIRLQTSLQTATCLDQVVTAHDSYLADIQTRALLDVNHEAFSIQVQLMLQSMLRFCSLEESLVADAMGTISRRRALLSDIKGRKAAGGKPSLLRGSTSSTASIADEEVEQDAIESDGLLDGSHMASGKAEGMTAFLVQRIDDSVNDFKANFNKIMVMLKEKGDQAEEIARFLTFKLDYNDFYSMSELGGPKESMARRPSFLLTSATSRKT